MPSVDSSPTLVIARPDLGRLRRVLHRRRLLESQGYEGLADSEVMRVEPWLRVGPAVVVVWATAAAACSSAPAMWLLAGATLPGLVATRQPLDLLVHQGLRHLAGAPWMPGHGMPRRFASGLVAVWAAASGAAFAGGAEATGIVLAGLLGCEAAVTAISGVCLPSAVFQRWARPLRQPRSD